MKRILRQLPNRVPWRRDCQLASSVYGHRTHTLAILEQFDPMKGWTCVDIRGPGGITDFLSPPAESTGRVVGLDMDHEFLERGRRRALRIVGFQPGDAYGSHLPADIFNLVYMRLSRVMQEIPTKVFKEAMRLARPRGLVAIQKNGWLNVEVLSAACG
jgi:ubiquinone/menaquinone biosynthesis C-methylase UbiE